MGLGSGFVNLFKNWGKGIGNAADNFWLGADAQKAIKKEIEEKFKSKIDLARRAESKKAANIKDLDDKLNESKANWKQAQDDWRQQYDAALANAKSQRQTDIADYDAKLQGYQEALNNANKGKQDILDQLYDKEAIYDLNKTIFRDVKSGNTYIFDPYSGGYKELKAYRKGLKTKKDIQAFDNRISNSEYRLFDKGSDRVINPFDDADRILYENDKFFNPYKISVQSLRNGDLRNADNQIKQAQGDLTTWQKNSRPADWNDVTDSKAFEKTYKKTNGKPNEYSFNGKTYSKEKDLEDAYNKALKFEQSRKDLADEVASKYASRRDAEIAQRIQDAKDMNKAKAALGGTLGAGALYAGARAMYGGDDTPDNTDNTNNIDNTDNTYTGEPDPDFNVEKEGQAILKDRQQSDTAPINADFDPDKADALAAAAYAKGVEDSNSIETPELAELSADDIHTNEGIGTRRSMNEGLFSVIKALQDPHQANAVADYIYSRYGNDPELQQLGWRAWLNKYYGDALRSQMNLDASGYNGMHIA